MATSYHPTHPHVIRIRYRAARTEHGWPAHVAWLGAALLLGFLVPFVFSSVLELPRDWFVAVYAAIVLPFVAVWARWAALDLRAILRRRLWIGLAAGVVLAALLAFSVVSQQDASPRAHGLAFAFDLLWLGLVYGVLDALFLNVMPVIATFRAAERLGWLAHWRGRLAAGALALAASLLVTAAYHLGYAEYRGEGLGSPLFGNLLMTLGYLLSSNPITAVLGHIALHVASVVHGVDATVTLPPHY